MTTALAIIGAGNMAEAIARGVLSKNVFPASSIIAADPSPQRRALFEKELNIRCVESAPDAARGAQRILLSVKPQSMKEVLEQLRPAVTDATLMISIAAGISSRFIEQHLSPLKCHVIRTMPNTPMLVGRGAVAMAKGSHATAKDLEEARQIFAPAATVIDVAEDKLDAVTALSGSGPAYFFYLVEMMIRAATEMGLTPEESRLLATQTALGASTMMAETADSPQELRRKVTSPKGTTHEAITHMEQHNLGGIVVDAIKAAQRRSKELGS